eukprot:scaffold103875_cov18-Tisochrysis_lutea.AAC.2
MSNTIKFQQNSARSANLISTSRCGRPAVWDSTATEAATRPRCWESAMPLTNLQVKEEEHHACLELPVY